MLSTSMLALVGAIMMDDSSGSPTVRAAVPEMPVKVAVMVDLPATSDVASPLLPAALETWAMVMLLADQVTCVVMSGAAPLS